MRGKPRLGGRARGLGFTVHRSRDVGLYGRTMGQPVVDVVSEIPADVDAGRVVGVLVEAYSRVGQLFRALGQLAAHRDDDLQPAGEIGRVTAQEGGYRVTSVRSVVLGFAYCVDYYHLFVRETLMFQLDGLIWDRFWARSEIEGAVYHIHFGQSSGFS